MPNKKECCTRQKLPHTFHLWDTSLIICTVIVGWVIMCAPLVTWRLQVVKSLKSSVLLCFHGTCCLLFDCDVFMYVSCGCVPYIGYVIIRSVRSVFVCECVCTRVIGQRRVRMSWVCRSLISCWIWLIWPTRMWRGGSVWAFDPDKTHTQSETNTTYSHNSGQSHFHTHSR